MVKQIIKGELSATHEFFNRSTRELAEPDSGFAPKEGMFTAAGQIAHVAQTINWFVDGAFASGGFSMEFEAMDKEVRAYTSIAAARAWFEKAVAHAHAVIEAHSDAEWMAALPPGQIMGGQPRSAIFGAINDHTAHHRGALTVYARLLGKVPPMPYMDRGRLTPHSNCAMILRWKLRRMKIRVLLAVALATLLALIFATPTRSF